MTFNPQEHMTNLKGKMYLEVKWRLVWFRDEHPSGGITTEVLSPEPLLVKAWVYNAEGQLLATGHAGAVAKANAVWSGREIEKAETAAIGRALGHAGYGSQFEPDDEGDYLADSPVEIPQKPAKQAQSSAQQPAQVSSQAAPQVDAETGEIEPIPYIAPGDKTWWPTFWKYVIPLYDHKNHAQASVKKMTDAGKISAYEMTVAQAVEAVRQHLQEAV